MSKEHEKYSIKDSFLGKVVVLHPNIYPFKGGKRYTWKGGLDELKDACSVFFDIHCPIINICTLEGKIVESIDQVKPLTDLVPLCDGEKIAGEKTKIPLKIKKVRDPCERPIEELDKIIGTPYRPPTKMKKEPIEDKFNYYIGMSKNSVERVLRLAEWSTFSNLSEKEQNKISTCDVLHQNITNDQLASFHRLLVEQDICGTTAENHYDYQMSKVSAKIMKKMQYNEVSLIITGPRYSGKSLFLNNFAMTYFRKLILAGLHSSFLYVPINFEYNILGTDDCFALYDTVLTACFQGATFCCLQLLPAIDALFQWFKELPFTTSTKKLPPILKNIKGLNFSDVEILGKTITKEFHFNDSKAKSRTDTAQSHMMKAISMLPSALASALGFESPLFVLDHVETCGEMFSQFLSKALSEAPYIIATKNDQTFFKQFKLSGATMIDMEGIIHPEDERYIVLKLSETITLDANDCLGCPGYILLFSEVCSELNREKAPQRRFSQLRVAPSFSNALKAKQSLLKLIMHLVEAGSPKLRADYLNEIIDSPKSLATVTGEAPDTISVDDSSDVISVDENESQGDKNVNDDELKNDKNEIESNDDYDQKNDKTDISSENDDYESHKKQKPPPQYFGSPNNGSPKGSENKSRKAPSIADFPETLDGYGSPLKTMPDAPPKANPRSPKGSPKGSPKSPTISIITVEEENKAHKHSNRLSNWESDDEPPVRKRKSLPAGKFRPSNYWA